jgi:eukaryotic-like serine/threonine-protein kinase
VSGPGADLIVEVALRHDRREWPRLVPQLCGADPELEALVRALLAHYDRPDAPLPSGPFPCVVGPFTLERELGAGAHGKVYLARRPPLDGYVALKLLRPGPGMSEFVEQVRREAGRARRIPSAHVVPVFDAGRIEGGPFYVEMAVCADPDEDSPGSIRIGRSLREAQPGLEPAEAARLVEDLARAVHAAHRTGVVHGDVKPENVLLTPETRRVMLADFGIATSLAASSATASTPVGTVAYMAPEQWRDRLAPSPASDVYTLGGTLYFLLSGVAPHAGREVGADAPPAPLPPAVPPRLREIVVRALSPLPEDRPSSAAALADELARFRALAPTWHDRRSPPRRALLFARRHARELVAIAAVLALLLPLGVAGYRVLTGRVGELAAREAALHDRIEGLDRSRAALERDLARLEGAADAKQKELARTEARLQQLPRLEQALGAAKEAAAQAEGALARREAEARDATSRAGALEAQVAAAREAQGVAREALAEVHARELAARDDAARASGERDEARRRVDELEAQLRSAEERRAGLERDLHDRELAIVEARAAAERDAARVSVAGRERDAARRDRAPATEQRDRPAPQAKRRLPVEPPAPP